MTCPLCNENLFLTLHKYEIADLSSQWQRQFGFDPFHGVSLGKTMDKRACIECGLIYFYPEFYGGRWILFEVVAKRLVLRE